MFDWTEAISKARRVVHDTFRVPVQYEAPGSGGVLVPLFVRWHDRLTLQGNIVDSGYVDVLQGVDRIIFDREELTAKSITPLRAGKVHFGDKFQNAVLALEAREPSDGPINEVWKVARL